MNTAPIAEYKTIGGYTVTLYENRIEIRQKLLGMNLRNQDKTIPIKSISKVEGPIIKPFKMLAITTLDGQEHSISLYYKDQLEFKRALNELL